MNHEQAKKLLELGYRVIDVYEGSGRPNRASLASGFYSVVGNTMHYNHWSANTYDLVDDVTASMYKWLPLQRVT